MARSLIDKIIYSITKKTKHYVEVKNPPKTAQEKLARPQDVGIFAAGEYPKQTMLVLTFYMFFKKLWTFGREYVIVIGV